MGPTHTLTAAAAGCLNWTKTIVEHKRRLAMTPCRGRQNERHQLTELYKQITIVYHTLDNWLAPPPGTTRFSCTTVLWLALANTPVRCSVLLLATVFVTTTLRPGPLRVCPGFGLARRRVLSSGQRRILLGSFAHDSRPPLSTHAPFADVRPTTTLLLLALTLRSVVVARARCCSVR